MRDRGKRCRFGVWERRSRLHAVHPGAALRQAVAANSPLLLTGTINAYTARMAERIGHQAIYLSGGGLAANSLGMPDLGISTLEDVLIDVRRITAVTKLPLLVDADTGFGSSAFNIARCIRELDRAGAAGCHIEDQVSAKRCGHRPGKAIVSTAEMCDRIKAAVDAREHDEFVIMARTDALAGEGMAATIDRAQAYIEAGADMLFPEAMRELGHYQQLREACRCADTGQHHRVRPHAAVFATGTGRCRCRHRAVLLRRLPRHEQGGRNGVSGAAQ